MRRGVLLSILAALGLAAFDVPAADMDIANRRGEQADALRIGIIGTGKIGSALAAHWAAAGHELLLSSRHPEQLAPLARRLGPRVRVGTPREAAAFGDVVLVSVPWGALPQVGKDYAAELAGKVVLDTANPYPMRDGPMAVEDRKRGTGEASAEYLPGVRLVRAFNAIAHRDLVALAHREPPVAIPIAGDDPDALEVASRLVRDAGFEPVIVGSLVSAREFDYGTSVYTKVLTADELREALGLPAAAR